MVHALVLTNIPLCVQTAHDLSGRHTQLRHGKTATYRFFLVAGDRINSLHMRCHVASENVEHITPLSFSGSGDEAYHQWPVMAVAIQCSDHNDFVVIYSHIVRGVTKDTGGQCLHHILSPWPHDIYTVPSEKGRGLMLNLVPSALHKSVLATPF